MNVKLKVGDYGFMNKEELPKQSFTEKMLPVQGIRWAVTSDFDDLAVNHCGATFVTNLAIYAARCGQEKVLTDGSHRATFIKIHALVGNGPVLRLAGKAVAYFKSRGCDLTYRSISGFDQIRQAINQGHPCGLLLMNAPLDWHWVMVIGYRIYEDGLCILQIMDGWHRQTQRFYLINHGSRLIHTTEYNLSFR